MAAPVLGIKEVCKDCELITLTENMLTALSCVGAVIILHSATAVRKSDSCESERERERWFHLFASEFITCLTDNEGQ
jgi:hypothetical protein